MPKLLPNLEESFLEHARQILCSEGYAALSIRRLAAECQTATGTVYNYYRNKDELVARVMMTDWRMAMRQMELSAQTAGTLEEGMGEMYRAIAAFVMLYQSAWSQYAQTGGSGGAIASHHAQLREQIAHRLCELAERTTNGEVLPVASLLAETLLSAAVQPDLNEEMLLQLTRLLARSPSKKG